MSVSSRSRRIRTIIASLPGSAVILFAFPSFAEQFVLFDATFTYTWDMASKSSPSLSHYYVNEGNWLSKARPVNWLSPVDYRNGSVHIRIEVFEKPSNTQLTGWALCYVGNAGSYGCPYSKYYPGPGVYENDVSMTSFFNNATIQWDRGVRQVDCVYTVNNSGSGHITNFPNLKDQVTPTRLRLTMIQVSKGSTYDPSILTGLDGGVPPVNGDAGTRDGGGRDGGGASDGSGGGGIGGSGGSGGAGGSDTTIGAGGSGGLGAGGAGGDGTATSGSTAATTTGGTTGAGGSAPTTGASSTGTTSSSSTNGTGAGGAGTTTGSAKPSEDLNGCNCSVPGRDRTPIAAGYGLMAGLAAVWARRRRRAGPRG